MCLVMGFHDPIPMFSARCFFRPVSNAGDPPETEGRVDGSARWMKRINNRCVGSAIHYPLVNIQKAIENGDL